MLKSLMAIVVFILIPLVSFSERLVCPAESTTKFPANHIGPAIGNTLPLSEVEVSSSGQGTPFTITCVYSKHPNSLTTRTFSIQLSSEPTGKSWGQLKTTPAGKIYSLCRGSAEKCVIDTETNPIIQPTSTKKSQK